VSRFLDPGVLVPGPNLRGKSLVIEYADGKVEVHYNPLGVLTDSPPFNWHLTNLRNNISATNVPALKLAGIKLLQIRAGSGMLRLPGDFTPPSRFVRAVVLTQSALPVDTFGEGVNLAINIINNINIAKGMTRDETPQRLYLNYTQRDTVYDLKNRRLYFRTYDNHNYRVVDLKRLDLTGGKIKKISMQQKADYQDISSQLK
jgi:choloylglycine hydrolase